ncbi:pseudouridine synthase [Microvirga sp. SRT01]|uniref:Pseudouridine synthase n=1 Tax=Sphingomonas longa TaxID=2778730 RepID=A0ABS2D4L3_9SPHN|nr:MULTISPECIES: pseudouridine synthase [Alphaproteobacteria]MBM6575054.1 pseudouridine synthase [Sphingomonas sp. BT552]MBR7708105.1 pseudouridine synthase [Microvirga sp. SRT01]
MTTDKTQDAAPESDRPEGDRIAKLLARAGIASRREVERMIEEGRVAVDGEVLDTPATVLTDLAGVTVDGKPVAAPEPARLFLYHKPPGLLVTEWDPAGRLTIYDRLPADLPRLVPVGRLDLATEGLLLLTTDGGLKRTLELPATGVERTYRARAYGEITQARLEELIDGIEIEGMRYGSIDANLERRTGANVWIELTLTEGKNREVRRVLEYLGLQVSRLIRTRYGPFVLGELQPNEIGEARGADIATFRRSLEGSKRGKGQDQAIVEVAARVVAPPSAPPTPATSRSVETERPRPEPVRVDRGAKPAAGWGSRTRPSRPAVEPDAPRTRGRPPLRDGVEVRAPRPASDGERSGRFVRDRGDAAAPRTGGGYRGDEARPPRSRAESDPRAGRDRSDDRPRNATGSRPFASRSDAAQRPTRSRSDSDPRADKERSGDRSRGGSGNRPFGSRGDGDQRPTRSRTDSDPRASRDRSDDRPRAASGSRPFATRSDDQSRARGPAPGNRSFGARTDDQSRSRGPSKGPAGGRGHPPRASQDGEARGRPDSGKPPARSGGGGKGPAGGRGHPPRGPKGGAPKGCAPRGGKR